MTTWWIPTMLLCAGAAWAQNAKEIRVRVYNQAGVPAHVLMSAEKEADFVLGTAAVRARFVDCSQPGTCDGALGNDELQIQIRPAAPGPRGRGVEGMGVALLPRDEPGTLALVYYNESCRLARRGHLPEGQLLGYVMAHEVGHLLLGPGHLDGTVMQGQWNKSELELMSRHELRFKPAQKASK